MTSTERAVRKASRERLLRDFARAARSIRALEYRAIIAGYPHDTARLVLGLATVEPSRTRYACLMTAFGL